MSDSSLLRAVDGDGDASSDIALALRGLTLLNPFPKCSEEFFESVAGPHALLVMEEARRGDVGAIRGADRVFESRLSHELHEEGRAAGSEIMDALASVKHSGFAKRIAGEGGLQWATAFGVRCAAFHVPPVTAVAAFRVAELITREKGCRHGAERAAVKRALESDPGIPAVARRIFERGGGTENRLHCA